MPHNENLTGDSRPTPTLHLVVGLPGAGKTTLARRLEREYRALRLTPDDWIATLYGAAPDQASLDAARDPVERLQWEVAARALELGVSVVLDFGFWSREERDQFRSRATAAGARTVVHALIVPFDELWSRLERRNLAPPHGTFRLKRQDLERWWSLFEPPGGDEIRSQLAGTTPMARKGVLAVVGAADADESTRRDARDLGAHAAGRGWIVVTGGRAKGVMGAALEGAKSNGGLAVGILPDGGADVSPAADVAIVTGMGEARNNIIVLTADVVVACGVDGAGTASEVSLAIKNGRHVVLLNASPEVIRFFESIVGERRELLHSAASAPEAMDCAERCLASSRRSGPR